MSQLIIYKNISYSILIHLKNGEAKIFFFAKKIITGPLSLKSMIVTLTIQLVPLILFLYFDTEVCIHKFINLAYIAIQKF